MIKIFNDHCTKSGKWAYGRYVIVEMDNGHGYLNLVEVEAFGISTTTATTTTTIAIGGKMFTAEDGTETSTRPNNSTSGDKPTKHREQTDRIKTILLCLFVVLTTLAVSGSIICTVLRRKESNVAVSGVMICKTLRSNRKALRSEENETKENLEIDRMDVEIGEEIGQGCFGKVFKGFFKGHAQVKQIIKQYKYFVQIGWVTGALCCQITSRSNGAE